MSKRSRAWCFTSYLTTVVSDHGSVKYLCYGKEKCPTTGKAHLQGYVEFENGVTLKSVKRRLGDPALHLEARRGTSKQARDYCAKDGEFFEVGELGKQGARTDLDGVRDCLAAGGGIRDVLDLGCSYQGTRMASVILTYRESKRSRPPRVVWKWGATGTGKSRSAYAEATEGGAGADDVYTHSGTKWWDGYDGHGVCILDDFRPEDMKFQYLLKLLDRYPFRVEVKGGFRQFRSDLIIITCPKPPEECYMEAGEDIDQLLRRIDTIEEMK